MTQLNDTVKRATERINQRSHTARTAYERQMAAAGQAGPFRSSVSCGNLAHAAAACPAGDKAELNQGSAPNLAIVTAYNDMLSAHQPLGAYPDKIKAAAREVGATAQIAGGVPAMCDGVTQGQAGMDLSLFSRDVIAMATAVSLSHNVFDGALMLGVCDKIVPGLFMGAARFGHLPIAFLPAGPMPSGLPNDEKARVRQLYAEGKVDRHTLLKAENDSYHSPGTCTFYGTANSNQMMMEVMGLHLPGSAFVNPGTPMRDAFVAETAKQVAKTTAIGDEYLPFYKAVDARAIVNAIIGLHATGGSTNHTIHIIAMAQSVGLTVDWDDFASLSDVVPLLARIYPNGLADVNHFHAAGGMGFVIRELIEAGLLHGDIPTITGKTLEAYGAEPHLVDGRLGWKSSAKDSADLNVLRPVSDPVYPTGGLVTLDGPIGRSVIKVSAVKDKHRLVHAPAIVFISQADIMARFEAGELNRDFIAVVPFQGPKANGMPELHKLTPPLGVLQDRGFQVALVTDGRMSGASGKVPAAIHMTPEALDGGLIGRIRDDDMMTLDAEAGTLSIDVTLEELKARSAQQNHVDAERWGTGRELFAGMRSLVTGAEQGAVSMMLTEQFAANALLDA